MGERAAEALRNMGQRERIRDTELAAATGLPLSIIRKAAKEGNIPRTADLWGNGRYTHDLRTVRFWLRKGGAERLRPPAKARHGFVYVTGFGPYVKIGFSKSVPRRLRGLKTGAPERLTTYAEMVGSTDLEHNLHKRFASLNTHGDWFRREGELAAWIAEGCPL